MISKWYPKENHLSSIMPRGYLKKANEMIEGQPRSNAYISGVLHGYSKNKVVKDALSLIGIEELLKKLFAL